MRKYLLDTNILTAYLKGRAGAYSLAHSWIMQQQAATSVLAYGEVIEHYKSFATYARLRSELRDFLNTLVPIYRVTYPVLERYADVRRALRRQYGGPGITLSDIDALIAATALEHRQTLVTSDSDFAHVPSLSLIQLTIASLK